MKNEELKKKIVEIIINAIWKDAEAEYDSTDETEACSIADALVAAGIGDVKERKFEADHYWSMWQGSLVELERAEHRAEVYERALYHTAIYERALYHTAIYERALYHTAISGTEYQEAIEQAEKELAEERKDD